MNATNIFLLLLSLMSAIWLILGIIMVFRVRNILKDRWLPMGEAPKTGEPVFATGLDWGEGPTRHYAAVAWSGDRWIRVDPEEPCLEETMQYLTHFMLIPDYEYKESKTN